MDTFQKTVEQEVLLSLRNASIKVSAPGAGRILEDVSWDIYPGEQWIVSGLHASGKTGILKAAAGLQRPVEGNLYFQGREYWGGSEEWMCSVRRKIGFIFEDGNRLISHLTVAKNIALPLCYHEDKTLKAVWGEVCEILKYLGILDYINLLPTQLNLYQRQQVAVAQAILVKPRIFFIDNLGEGLDVVQRLRIRRLLRGLSCGIASLGLEPAVVVMATQDLPTYLDFGTHYGIIAENSFLTFQGQEALRSSVNPVVKKLLGNWSED